jgi:hypothetical protein
VSTFEEYQAVAAKAPLSLRNDRDCVSLPVLGLQQEARKIGSLLTTAFASGKLVLMPKQTQDLKDRLSDMLWCLARLCGETGITMQDVAKHSIAQLRSRTQGLDADRR